MVSFLCVTLFLSVFENCLADYLATNWAYNSGSKGIEWDTKANEDVVINSIDFETDGCDSNWDVTFVLYTKAGSHVGFEG